MPKSFFVVGIGGTGMRCIESFIHLCAMGMFDDTEIHLLAMDTDKENGNFTRLTQLKDCYQKTKGIKGNKYALKESFFSANLKDYMFCPNYFKTDTNNFEKLFHYDDAKNDDRVKTDIADLLLTKEVQQFDLKHGYRAQTHLGSMLMYHAIIENAQSSRELNKFVEALVTASQSGVQPRIFIFGSVFGGTGASSIPIIPKALSKAASIVSNFTDIEKNAYFGAIILSSYFSFPNKGDLATQKVIATSDKFSMNSQAAMMFYESDSTVRNTYQRFYLLGTSGASWEPSKNKDQTITGGIDQENDSHYIELIAATAAYNFYSLSDAELLAQKQKNQVEYVYRTIDESEKLSFIDFVGIEKKEVFAKKFGLLIALSFLAGLDNYDFFQQAQNGNLTQVGISGYGDIDKQEIDNLKKYIHLFHFTLEESRVKDGWLRQLNRSAHGGDKFLFHPDLFSLNSKKEFEAFDFNDTLYQTKSDFARHKFSKAFAFGPGSNRIFSAFKEEFLKVKDPENVTNKCEKLIKRTYDTLCNLYKF